MTEEKETIKIISFKEITYQDAYEYLINGYDYPVQIEPQKEIKDLSFGIKGMETFGSNLKFILQVLNIKPNSKNIFDPNFNSFRVKKCYKRIEVNTNLTIDKLKAIQVLYPDVIYIAMDMDGKAYLYEDCDDLEYSYTLKDWNYDSMHIKHTRIDLLDKYIESSEDAPYSCIKIKDYIS